MCYGTREDESRGYGREKKTRFVCVEDVAVLSTFVDCVGSVDGLGSSVRAWV